MHVVMCKYKKKNTYQHIVIICLMTFSIYLLNYNTLTCVFCQVHEHFKKFTEYIQHIREVEPAVCRVVADIRHDFGIPTQHLGQEIVFEGNFYCCGKCLNFASKRRNCVKRHTTSCLSKKNVLTDEEKRQRQRDYCKKYRRNLKIKQVSAGIVPPKRSRTVKPSSSVVNVESNSNSTVTENTITTAESEMSDINAPDYSHSERTESVESPETECLDEYDIELEESTSETCQQVKFIKYEDNKTSFVNQVFQVKDLHFLRAIEESDDVGEVWRPNKCIVGLSGEDGCSISLHGSRIRQRVFDYPLPIYIRHPQLICTTHNKVFNYLSNEVAQQMPPDVFPTEKLIVMDSEYS